MKKVTYRELLFFFLPLGLRNLIVGSTHTIINAAMARLPRPELSLAVFAVTKSVTNIIKSPILMSKQVIISFVNNKSKFFTVIKFILSLSGIVFLIIFLLGFSPLGEWFIKNIMGLKEREQIEFASLAFKIMCFIPLIQLIRDIYQGIAIALKKTSLFLPGVVIRIIVIAVFLIVVVKGNLVTGITAGSLTWLGGIGIEGIFILGYLIYLYKSPFTPAEDIEIENDESDKVEYLSVFKFFLPLGLMTSLRVFTQPLIQSGIARSTSPTVSLAAYGVSFTLIMFITGCLKMIHQCSLVYITEIDDENWNTVFRFSLAVGIFISIITLLVGITPLGEWILYNLIAVSAKVGRIARKTILAFCIFPLIRAFRQIYWGLLMKQKTTSIILIGKITNILFVILTFVTLFYFSVIESAVIGALAFTAGETVEAFLIWNYSIGGRIRELLSRKDQGQRRKDQVINR
ncbi:MAG: hypothetical protein ACOC4G_05485 [Bacillota bacterium]